MQQITLGTSGRQTTQLGFGGSSLMGALSRRDSLRLLEAAFDAGIRHFDVAPMYGYGQAEACLGEFLKRHRADVTVTTKYGIPPAKNSSLISLARRIVGPVVKSLPGLKQRLAGAANLATRNTEKATFTPAEARASLERSLTALATTHIDVWLLHEVEAEDLRDDDLLRFLEDQVSSGAIGTFGVGSEGDKIRALQSLRPAYCRTLQYEWSVLDRPIEEAPTQSKSFRIHHRALTNNFRSLHAALIQRKEICKRWSAATDTDLSKDEDLARLMLKASLAMNPTSVILFSSKKPTHIVENVETASDTTLEDPARQLYSLVQSEEGQTLFTSH